MSDDPCIFCEIVAGRASASVVYQDDQVMAFMDLFPVNEGHLLVVPKTHATYLKDMDEQSGMQVFRTAHRLAPAVRDSGVRCEGINLFLADGEVAGQEVFHVHLHVLPRYTGDPFDLRVGEKGEQPRTKLDRVAGMIRAAL